MKIKYFYKQQNARDCGPACLRMVAKYYGKHFNSEGIRRMAGYSKEGVSLLGISEAAENIGFRTRGLQLTYKQLVKEAILPAVLHWEQNHFVVIPPLPKKRIWQSIFQKKDSVLIADPSRGLVTYTKDLFLKHWISTKNDNGTPIGSALLLEPSPKFYELEGDKVSKLNWGIVFQYLRNSQWQIAQVFLALFITSILQLLVPFLTQSFVDTGITTKNLEFITLVLIAQLMLVFSRSVIDFIRNYLLLGISSIINLSMLSDFLIKLSRLPIAHFDIFHTGDTLQRLGDNRQVQKFLTGSALNTLFSLFNFIIFAFVLLNYNSKLFFVFLVGTGIYLLWIKLFLGVRRKLNFQAFHLSVKESNATLQMVQGMQEIKLQGAEHLKRWEWENIQASIFKLNFKNLSYTQLQQSGVLLINQGKDILIIFLVAKLVVEGKLSLGALLAVQYIIGQLSGPVEQLIGFIQSAQDAKISLERLNEIHSLAEEEAANTVYLSLLPRQKSIIFEHFSFSYPGASNEPVLKNISLTIEEGKTTAIVGISGSGKTTLLKMLLQFYSSYKGTIKVGDCNMRNISPSFWRRHCGAVMQEGFIFNDTIAKNITVGDGAPDFSNLIESCKIANILSFIESMPNGFNTKLGVDGIGISQGQRQRILIARAVYKNPTYLLFDEATNSLDANNEKEIVEHLQDFIKGKTVVVVAHRLSSVKHADKIIVLQNGEIVEQGTHQQLSELKGKYFELVKNQLEMSN